MLTTVWKCDSVGEERGESMKKVLVFTAFFVLVVMVNFPTAQESPKFKARVRVSVTASESIKGTVTSYINRELRSLQDVELVDRDEEYELKIMAMELSDAGGYNFAIALSAVSLIKFPNQLLSNVVPNSYKEAIVKLTSGLYYYPIQWLITGPTRDLRKLCSDVVATFDTESLEEGRQSHRKIQDILKNAK